MELDLQHNRYDRNTLKKHIYSVKLIDLVKTQHLDTLFVVRYILKTNYQFCDEDKNIVIDTILFYQKHLERNKLMAEIENYTSDDDSIEPFDSDSYQ
jgi:hypothetical protein